MPLLGSNLVRSVPSLQLAGMTLISGFNMHILRQVGDADAHRFGQIQLIDHHEMSSRNMCGCFLTMYAFGYAHHDDPRSARAEIRPGRSGCHFSIKISLRPSRSILRNALPLSSHQGDSH
jgi:hypothetical protein